MFLFFIFSLAVSMPMYILDYIYNVLVIQYVSFIIVRLSLLYFVRFILSLLRDDGCTY